MGFPSHSYFRREKGNYANAARFYLFQALVIVVTCFYTFSISKCLMKVIQRTILAVILTVKTLWLLHMNPRCRTPESAHAHHKFKAMLGSYAVRSQLLSYTPIKIGK